MPTLTNASVGPTSSRIAGGNWVGTGALVDFEGYPVIVTTAHHWNKGNTVGTWSKKYEIRPIAIDNTYDIAICSVTVEEDLKRLKLAETELKAGQVVRIGGWGSGFKTFDGKFMDSVMPESSSIADWFRISVPVRQGDSGSPVIGQTGECVGIVHSSTPESSCSTGSCGPTGSGHCVATKSGRILRLLRANRSGIRSACWLLRNGRKFQPEEVKYEVKQEEVKPAKPAETVPIETVPDKTTYPWYYVLIAPAIFLLFVASTLLFYIILEIKGVRK